MNQQKVKNKTKDKIFILVVWILGILFVFPVVIEPVDAALARPVECVVISANHNQSALNRRRRNASSMWIETEDCGYLSIGDTYVKGRNLENATNRINNLKGKKVKFLIGPFSNIFGTNSCSGIIFPDNGSKF